MKRHWNIPIMHCGGSICQTKFYLVICSCIALFVPFYYIPWSYPIWKIYIGSQQVCLPLQFLLRCSRGFSLSKNVNELFNNECAEYSDNHSWLVNSFAPSKWKFASVNETNLHIVNQWLATLICVVEACSQT